MCGIVGLIFNGNTEQGTSLIKQATQTLHHRGPDAFSYYNNKDVYLGHSRLKIIDLSDSSNQPLVYNDDVVVSFNGEIYNYQTLRTELKKNNWKLNTNGDAEVIAAAYKNWGIDFINHLDGMFAISIYDLKLKRIYLIRDHFGKKPLYYSTKKKIFSFASELNPFKCFYGDLDINMEAMNHFLSIGYILNPLTPYQDVNLLPPASILTYDLEDHSMKIRQFFNYADCFREKNSFKDDEIVERTKDYLQKAIQKRFVGDVPKGVFLSSGIDSSGIAAIAFKDFNEKLPCYTIGFKNSEYDESKLAQQFTVLLGLKHKVIDLKKLDKQVFDTFIKDSDYILGDNSMFPMYCLSKEAKTDVSFVLGGDGSDEIFGGYSTYKADDLNLKIRSTIPFLKKIGISRLISEIFSHQNDRIGFSTKLNRFFSGINTDFAKAHYNWRVVFSPEQRVEILGKEYKDLVYESDPMHKFLMYYKEVEDLDKKEQHLFVDAKTWLTDNNLIKIDRSSMAHGLEIRSPYLDIDLVKFVASCPVDLKKDKILLKKVLAIYLPKEVLNKSKKGFNSPIGHWFGVKENEFEYYTKFIYQQKYL